MRILTTFISDFILAREPKPKPTKVQKHQARELADAKMALAKCETAEEYCRFQAEMYRATIDRIEGTKGIELRMLDIGVSQ